MTYEQGLNISDLEVLCTAADQLGLIEARHYLVCSFNAIYTRYPVFQQINVKFVTGKKCM